MKQTIIFGIILVILISGCDVNDLKKIDTTKITNTTKEFIETTTEGSVKISVIDVGQGNAQLIQTPNNHFVLIDCGDNAHGATVVNYLREQGVRTLDYLIISHAHEDHIGGCDDVLMSQNVKVVKDNGNPGSSQSYTNYQKLINQEYAPENITIKPIDYTPLKSDSSLAVDGITLQLFVPYDGAKGYDETDENQNSIVAQITYGNTAFILPGDCGARCENNIKFDGLKDVDVLVVGHHGSITSTTDTFLDTIKPEWAVISVGLNNRYKHPAPETIEELQSRNITIWQTSTNGTITITTNGKEVKIV